jgi:pyridoxamine 5'-phosphate oxidase
MALEKKYLYQLRREYYSTGLLEEKSPQSPFKLFERWFKQAVKFKEIDPNAMVLSTIRKTRFPCSRVVLMKQMDQHRFVFFTNYKSDKGKELDRNPRASLLFYWPKLNRQIRIEGQVFKLSFNESTEYFKTRPRQSQISAWASEQSSVLKSRHELLERIKYFKHLYQGKVIPRPPSWGGYRFVPSQFEFWQGQPNRLHDRLVYRHVKHQWQLKRLFP